MSYPVRVFEGILNLIDGPGCYEQDGHPAQRLRPDGEFEACVCTDPRASRFTLFGAVWRVMVRDTPSDRMESFKRFTALFRAALGHSQYRPLVEHMDRRDRYRGIVNQIDAWAADKSQEEVVRVLRAVIETLRQV